MTDPTLMNKLVDKVIKEAEDKIYEEMGEKIS